MITVDSKYTGTERKIERNNTAAVRCEMSSLSSGISEERERSEGKRRI